MKKENRNVSLDCVVVFRSKLEVSQGWLTTTKKKPLHIDRSFTLLSEYIEKRPKTYFFYHSI